MTNTILTAFRRTTRSTACPICGKPDWCLVGRADTEQAGLVVCSRTTSPTRWGTAGWLHRLDGAHAAPKGLRRGHVVDVGWAGPGKIGDLLQRCARDDGAGRRRELAQHLGVTEASLLRLDSGWISAAELNAMGQRASSGAWTFPMREHTGAAIGVRLRTSHHKKYSVSGSRNGLFLPSCLPVHELLCIAEGESDTAALLDLGFAAIGRPGARSCGERIVRFVRRNRPTEIVVLADNDECGREGATELARQLRLLCARVRVVAPPPGFKDVRAWKRRGATHADLVNQITASPMVGMSLAVEGRG